MTRNRPAEIAAAIARSGINRRRFRQAVQDGLTLAQLAERFGLSVTMASHMRKALRG